MDGGDEMGGLASWQQAREYDVQRATVSRLFPNVAGDLRFAWRQLRRKPGSACAAVLMLALGTGSSTAAFSVLYQALLRPLPYPDAGRLCRIHNALPRNQVALTGVSAFDYAEISRRGDVFESAGIFYWNDLAMTSAGAARHVDAVNASASVFATLGVKPLMGRTYSAEEDRDGAPRTAVLSEHLWRDVFGADPRIAGRSIHLNGLLYTVTGVMPRSFAFPSRATELWIPVAMRPGGFTLQGGRMEKWLQMVARLAPGVTPARADAALGAIGDGLAASLPRLYPKKEGWHFAAKRLAEENTEAIRRWLYLAFGGVSSVLLIACVNVSGLLLIRAVARSREIAVRIALGATRFRIARQILTETALLVCLGCALGLFWAVWAVHLMNVYGPLPEPTPMQGWTLLFAFTAAVASTMGAGLVPALLSAELPIEAAAKGGAMRTATRTGGWRGAIVAVQIALAFTLIFTAAELSRSFLNMTRVPPGFAPGRLWSGAVDLPPRAYTADQSWNTKFFEPLLERLRQLPGVESASAGNAIPFNPSGIWTERLRLSGRPAPDRPAEAQILLALPGYFETMNIPLLRGRTFTSGDRAGAPLVAVIDQELAQRYFPGEDAIGKEIASGGAQRAAVVVGIAGSVHNSNLGGDREPEVYYPELQERTGSMYLVLRMKSAADPTAAVRASVAALDRGVALYDVRMMDGRVAASLRLRRFVAFLLNGFAAAGIVLAGVGLYGSLAHLVELRRREIGIRMALGARPSHVLGMILTYAGFVVTAGAGAGAAGAVAAGRAVRSQLFGTGPNDAGTWVGVVSAMAVAAALALALPAWRAVSVDPALTLRDE